MNGSRSAALIAQSKLAQYNKYRSEAWRIQIAIHELLGHGTGKLLMETSSGHYNFDIEHPPRNPITGSPIDKWYKPGETWTGVFGNIATSVDECRAECVGAYLITDKELLAVFGYNNETEVSADDCTCQPSCTIGGEGRS